jgi:hypothetical protein
MATLNRILAPEQNLQKKASPLFLFLSHNAYAYYHKNQANEGAKEPLIYLSTRSKEHPQNTRTRLFPVTLFQS